MLVFQHIDIAHWAGLGGVRYIPSEYVDTETGNLKELDESEVKMINQRNMELVSHHEIILQYFSVVFYMLSIFGMYQKNLNITHNSQHAL